MKKPNAKPGRLMNAPKKLLPGRSKLPGTIMPMSDVWVPPKKKESSLEREYAD